MNSPPSSFHLSSPKSTFSGPQRRQDASSSSELYVTDETLGPLTNGRRPSTIPQSELGLDIEEYRVGGPMLPMLPLAHLSVPESIMKDFIDNLQEPLTDIVRQHSLSTDHRTVVLITLRSEGEPDAALQHYAYVSTQWSPGCQELWIQVADAMIAKLREMSCDWLKVLIADDRAMHSPRTETVAADDLLRPAWRMVANNILDAIEPRNKQWLSIDLLWRWKEWNGGSETKRVKVVLCIRWDSDEDWGSAADTIKAVINNNAIYKDRAVDLEITRGPLRL